MGRARSGAGAVNELSRDYQASRAPWDWPAWRPGLQICERTSQRLVLRDAPGRVWVIRSFFALFILGGLICLGMVLGIIGKSERPLQEWEFFLGLTIGCGVLFASLAMLGQGPRSLLTFDRDSGTVTVDRSGPMFGREQRSYALAEIFSLSRCGKQAGMATAIQSTRHF